MPPISNNSNGSIPEFLRHLEYPSEEAALCMARESLAAAVVSDFHGVGRCCCCAHLQEYFPHGPLDLEFVNDGKRQWRLRNPIHQVHFESQPLRDLLVISEDTHTNNTNGNHPRNPTPPIILYGEEHERLLALKKFATLWHPHLEHPPPLPPHSSSREQSRAVLTRPTTTTTATTTATTTGGMLPRTTATTTTTTTTTTATTTASTIMAPPDQQNTNATLTSSLPSLTTTGAGTDRYTPQQLVTSIETTVATTLTCGLVQATDATEPDSKTQQQATTSASAPVNIESQPKEENSTPLPMETSTTTTSTATTTTVATPNMKTETIPTTYSALPESTFLKWHTCEGHIQTLRSMFLGKRSSSSAWNYQPTSMVGLKINSGSTSSTYSKKSKPKQPHPLSSLTDSQPSSHSRFLHMAAWIQPSPSLEPIPEMRNSSMSPNEALEWYETRQKQIVTESEEMMERFRTTRLHYYYHHYNDGNHQRQQQHYTYNNKQESLWNAFQTPLSRDSTFGTISGTKRRFSTTDDDYDPIDDEISGLGGSQDVYPPRCHLCCFPNSNPRVGGLSFPQKRPVPNGYSSLPFQDHARRKGEKEILQCLECSFVGCMGDTDNGVDDSSSSFAPKHAVQHWLTSHHKFAVTCGSIPRIYCFECGDYVYHSVFDQEDERVQVSVTLPWMAWNEHAVLRSTDVWRFAEIPDLGIFWKGPQASYPILVPREHVKAMRRCRHRQIVFHGDIEALSVRSSRETKDFTVRQFRSDPNNRWRLGPPVGMYNLGNTCFMSAILQCLLHCTPLQRYFLRDVGHDHEACAIYRSMDGLGNVPSFPKGKSKQAMNVCLACELDKIFLQNLSSTTGVDVLTAVSCLQNDVFATSFNGDKSIRAAALIKKGDPLIPSTMLTSVWKCGGMKHLAGYDQRDAHEFLHSFLEILGEHVKLYWSNVQKAINMARPDNAVQELNGVENSPRNEIKKLFEGTLRSVLICQSCGVKRAKPEPFMSISLPLSKEIQLMMANSGPDHSGVEKLSVELCLQHFTMPEKLSDPVHCPNCGKKTPTNKQHVVSKLPKILCLHLKRFDASTNKKIEDFVSFPSHGLNMGPYLPHWCELSQALSLSSGDADGGFIPDIMYDLFATVNHFGNLQSGHYVSNIKVGGKWYHCNDSHVGFAGADSGEAEVLKSEGAYVLFYIRR